MKIVVCDNHKEITSINTWAGYPTVLPGGNSNLKGLFCSVDDSSPHPTRSYDNQNLDLSGLRLAKALITTAYH